MARILGVRAREGLKCRTGDGGDSINHDRQRRTATVEAGSRRPRTGIRLQPDAKLRAIRAYAEWLWIDSKFSASTAKPSIRGSDASRAATPRTRSSTKRGLS